jgi:hypothetical protein
MEKSASCKSVNIIYFGCRLETWIISVLHQPIWRYEVEGKLHLTVREQKCWKMASSGMLRHVALVRTDFSVESSSSINRVTKIGELETTVTVASNRRTLTFFLVHQFLSLWSWKCQVPPKHRFLQEPNGVTSHKTIFLHNINRLGSVAEK